MKIGKIIPWAEASAVVLSAALLTIGCSYRNIVWHDVRRVAGYKVPAGIPIVLDVSEAARESDQAGYVDTMVLSLHAELLERGLGAGIVSPRPKAPPLPRIEIAVRAWDEGSFGESYAAGVGVSLASGGWVPIGNAVLGRMKLVVLCQFISRDNRVMFSGIVEGSQSGDSNPRDLAEAAGEAVAEAIVDGDYRLSAPNQRGHS